MTDLLTLARKHDLPPKWNGRVVQWEPWREALTVLCLKVRSESCDKCGSTAAPLTAGGMVALRRSTTLDTITSFERFHRVGMVALRRLAAFRCPDCHHDTIWDHGKDEWWDLDHTDYGDDGSSDPDGRW